MTGRMKIEDIGEIGLINKISGKVKTDKTVIKGIGDDAAVIKFTADKYLLFKTDMVVEGVHFTKDMPPTLIGRKALARNISDIAAMGGVPKYAVICLGISPQENVKVAEGIFKGINNLAKEFGINIVGGDTSRAARIFISVALVGEVEKSCVVFRNTANKGDLILVSGRLGASFSTGKHLKFIPRLNEARFLVKKFKPTSMMDISDGLVLDLNRLLEAGKKGAFIYEEFLPKTKGASLEEALYGGEDYELLFTLPGKRAAGLIREMKKSKQGFSFTCIGEIVDRSQGLIFVNKRYRLKKLLPKGFAHF